MATKTNTKINGQEYYRIRRTVGHKMIDGKRKAVIKSFYGSSKGDAEQKYKDYVNEQARIRYESQREMDISTLHDRANQFISTTLDTSSKYADGTRLRYKSAYRVHIENTYLDRMLVKDIHASDIQGFYNSLNVTDSVIKAIGKFMSALYKWMTVNGYAENVISAVELPAKNKNKRQDGIEIWDNESWDLLTSDYFDFSHDFLIKLLCYTGMRISECLGLKYSDIQGNVIHVSRQYNLGELKPPKFNSVREIPMHSKLIEAYDKHRHLHLKEMRQNKYKSDFIFTTNTGGMMDIKNLHRSFDRFYKRQSIPRHTFKTYRSTFCTKLCEAGVPIEVASKILGHKSMQVTAQHYALVRQDTKKDAIELLK